MIVDRTETLDQMVDRWRYVERRISPQVPLQRDSAVTAALLVLADALDELAAEITAEMGWPS